MSGFEGRGTSAAASAALPFLKVTIERDDVDEALLFRFLGRGWFDVGDAFHAPDQTDRPRPRT